MNASQTRRVCLDDCCAGCVGVVLARRAKIGTSESYLVCAANLHCTISMGSQSSRAKLSACRCVFGPRQTRLCVCVSRRAESWQYFVAVIEASAGCLLHGITRWHPSILLPCSILYCGCLQVLAMDSKELKHIAHMSSYLSLLRVFYGWD